jgi:hypothetical protein
VSCEPDSLLSASSPARPPRREKRGKTQGVKARVASFSVEAAAQKTPITQLQEYCVNVLKTAPRYVTTTQGLAPLKLLEASRLIMQGDREKRWFRPLATQYSIPFLFICPFISHFTWPPLFILGLMCTAEDPTRPYVTTVEIAGREYGRGAYINKKQSKVSTITSVRCGVILRGVHHQE